MRLGPDGCVICGGEDEDFSDEATRDALLPAKIEAIRSKLSKLLPTLDTRPAYMWCGNFGASKTGTPSIGRVPGMANCHAVLGYGGNGITFSMMAAQMLTTLLTGGTDPDADLFSFTRDF
jgi:glycine/D-amino acid oxidase-like deaminating enzyme